MEDVKWIKVEVPMFTKTHSKKLANGNTVTRALKVDPASWHRDGILAFFEKGCRIWTDQVGAKDMTAPDFTKALDRVDAQLKGEIPRHAGGGPRLDPVFRFVRDRAAAKLDISPTTILDLEQIVKTCGKPFVLEAMQAHKAMLEATGKSLEAELAALAG